MLAWTSQGRTLVIHAHHDAARTGVVFRSAVGSTASVRQPGNAVVKQDPIAAIEVFVWEDEERSREHREGCCLHQGIRASPTPAETPQSERSQWSALAPTSLLLCRPGGILGQTAPLSTER